MSQFLEVYVGKGRVAMTVVGGLDDDSVVQLVSTADVTAASVDVYPVKTIWVDPEAVRNQPRVYGPSV